MVPGPVSGVDPQRSGVNAQVHGIAGRWFQINPNGIVVVQFKVQRSGKIGRVIARQDAPAAIFGAKPGFDREISESHVAERRTQWYLKTRCKSHGWPFQAGMARDCQSFAFSNGAYSLLERIGSRGKVAEQAEQMVMVRELIARNRQQAGFRRRLAMGGPRPCTPIVVRQG